MLNEQAGSVGLVETRGREEARVAPPPRNRRREFLQEEPSAATHARVVVLGVGNILLSDEGIGVWAIETLKRDFVLPEEVEVIDGGTSGMELLDELAYAAHLIIVDAVLTGRPPASIVRLAGPEVPVFFRTKISPHQLGLSDVLAALALTGEMPKDVVLIGIEPLSLDPAMELTAEVSAQLPGVVNMVVAEIRGLGFSVTRATDN